MTLLSRPKATGRWAAALLGVIGLAVLVRLAPMQRGFGEDELYTVSNFVDGAEIADVVSNTGAFNNHIGYSLVAQLAVTLFGRSEEAIRLPALLFGLATLGVLWRFSKDLMGTSPALLSTLLLALSPRHIGMSTEARGYSGMVLLTLTSSYLFLKLLREPNIRQAVAYVMATVLALYIHLYSGFTFAAQVVFLCYLVGRRQAAQNHALFIHPAAIGLLVKSFIVAGVLAFLLYLPALRDIQINIAARGHSSFQPSFPWLVLDFLYGGGKPVGALVAAGLAGAGGWHLLRSRPLEARYCLLLLTGPLLVLWLIRPYNLYARFFAFCLPYYLVLLVAGLVGLWRAAPRPEIRVARISRRALALAITGLLTLDWWPTAIYEADEGYRAATSRLTAAADASVAFCAIGGSRSMWAYYVRRPLAKPRSIAELQALSRSHSEVRCFYYEAWWQDDQQTQLAKFLFENAVWARANDTTTLFWFRAGDRPPRSKLR